jgi:hypothetical protein
MDVSRIDITELADLLKNTDPRKTALILGSRVGALFRSQSFIEEMSCHSRGPRSFMDMNECESFSACYNILRQAKVRYAGNDLEISLKHMIESIDLSMADECIAELVKQEVFKLILSFNPDDLLYNAFTALDLKKERNFVEFDLDINGPQAVDDMFERMSRNRKACNVVKFFNDVDALLYTLDEPQELESISGSVKTLLERMRIKEVLIVGIDLTWDSIILSALPSRHLKAVWFVNEDERTKDVFCEKYHDLWNVRFITGNAGRYDIFLRTLHFQINPGILPFRYELTSQLQNQFNIVQQELKSLKDGIKSLQKTNEQIQRQLTRLSRQVEEARKSDRDKRE